MAVCAGCVQPRTVVALRAEQGWCARCICAHSLHLSAIEVKPEPSQENWLTVEDMRVLLARDGDTNFVFTNVPTGRFVKSLGVDENYLALCMRSSHIRGDEHLAGGEIYGIQMILYAATKEFVPFTTIATELQNPTLGGQFTESSLKHVMKYLKENHQIGGSTHEVYVGNSVSTTEEEPEERFRGRYEGPLIRWLWDHFDTVYPLPVLVWHVQGPTMIYGIRMTNTVPIEAEILHTSAYLSMFEFDYTRPVVTPEFPRFYKLICWDTPFGALGQLYGTTELFGPVVDMPVPTVEYEVGKVPRVRLVNGRYPSNRAPEVADD